VAVAVGVGAGVSVGVDVLVVVGLGLGNVVGVAVDVAVDVANSVGVTVGEEVAVVWFLFSTSAAVGAMVCDTAVVATAACCSGSGIACLLLWQPTDPARIKHIAM